MSTSSSSSISDLLYSWKSSCELRSRLLQVINDELSSSARRAEAGGAGVGDQYYNDLFISILSGTSTSAVIAQPALAHDPEVLCALLKLLVFIIVGGNVGTTKMMLMIHSRHICSVISAIQNRRRAFDGNAKRKNDIGSSEQELFLTLLYHLMKLFLTSSSNQNNKKKNNSIHLIPSDSIASIVQSLLDIDPTTNGYFSSSSSATTDDENNNHSNGSSQLFSLLQQFVTTEPGQQSFIKYGGPLVLSKLCLSQGGVDDETNTDENNENKNTMKMNMMNYALSVLHAATSCLDVCIELNKFNIINQYIVRILNDEIVLPRSTPAAEAEASSSSLSKTIPLHCLGIFQNYLREISCSKQFWKLEQNIEVLVKASLDPRVKDESIRSQAMVILLANAANQEREIMMMKNNKREPQTNQNAKIEVKKDFKRCLSAAHSLALVEECSSSFEEVDQQPRV